MNCLYDLLLALHIVAHTHLKSTSTGTSVFITTQNNLVDATLPQPVSQQSIVYDSRSCQHIDIKTVNTTFLLAFNGSCHGFTT